MNSPAIIKVSIWGKQVGVVARDAQRGAYAFEYTPAWRREGIELAPLMMPLTIRSPHIFPSLNEETFHRLPGLLADALPDRFGNALINAWMAEKGVDAQAVTALDKMAYMGKRGMGALEFKPASGSKKDVAKPLEMQTLVEAARKAVSGSLQDAAATKEALSDIIRVGTSAGGARAKAVIALNPDTKEMRSGQFDVPDGFEHWLLKFDGMGEDGGLGAGQEYGRIEYAYYLMASEAGIQMSPCQLLEENGRAHFMTKRFDRSGNEKHHVQTLCAMAHLDFNLRETNAYEQFFQTIRRLNLGPEALREAFRRMVFNVIAKNCDDHTKNFAFILKKDVKEWALAPAYDVTFAHNPSNAWTKQHLMSVGGKFSAITESDMVELASKFMIPTPKAIIARVRDAVAKWSKFARQAGVSSARTERIRGYFELL